MMKPASIAPLALMSLILAAAGCHAKTPASDASRSSDRAIKQKIEALKAKTLKDLVAIKGGTFMMGDFGFIDPKVNLPYSGDTNDDVLHKVTLSDYALGAYKVTYADFDVFTAATGRPKIAQQEMDLDYRDLPDMAAGVNWYDAQAYCQWIGQQVGRSMDLPTEAQWEYAARDRGKMVVWPTDNGVVDNGRNVARVKHYRDFAREHNSTTYYSSIGLFPPTPLGLYDMIDHGFEWVRDWYAPEYGKQDVQDPTGPLSGTKKVKRGHSDQGGDSLFLVSMTMTRFHSIPSPAPQKAPFEDNTNIPINQNMANTFRCSTTVK